MPAAVVNLTSFTVIDAVRYWRVARDEGQPVQPALFVRLGAAGFGLLAPVVDGLMTLFEATFRRRFDAGAPLDSDLTDDEKWLIEALEKGDTDPPVDARPSMVAAMRTAFRSTRIMLGSVIPTARQGLT